METKNITEITIKIIFEQTHSMLLQMQNIVNLRINTIENRRIELLPYKKNYIEFVRQTEHEYYNMVKLRQIIYNIKDYHNKILVSIEKNKDINKTNLQYNGIVPYKYNNE